MTTKINELMMVAMHRAGRPLDSAELLDLAEGLGIVEDWPTSTLALLNRKSIAKRLTNMETAGLVVAKGSNFDEASRRSTPCYVPADGFNPAAAVPSAPTEDKTSMQPYKDMERPQLMAVLAVQDEMLQTVARFLADMSAVRERARTRLESAGLGEA